MGDGTVYRPRPPGTALRTGVGMAINLRLTLRQRLRLLVGGERVWVAVWVSTSNDPGDIAAEAPRVAIGRDYPAELRAWLSGKRGALADLLGGLGGA